MIVKESDVRQVRLSSANNEHVMIVLLTRNTLPGALAAGTWLPRQYSCLTVWLWCGCPVAGRCCCLDSKHGRSTGVLERGVCRGIYSS